MARPATGKTPLRNMRLDDLVWLPALARTVAEDTTITDVVEDTLSQYGTALPGPPLTFGHWPDAAPWLDAHYRDWRNLASAIQAASPGLADTEFIGVALWRAMTRGRDGDQQRHIVAGFLLLAAKTTKARRWQEKHPSLQALLRAVNQVLAEQMPGRQSPPGNLARAGGPAPAARRKHSSP